MMEVTPEPSVILPFNAHQPQSVWQAFRIFGVICDTLAAASRVIDLMPGNEHWVIQRLKGNPWKHRSGSAHGGPLLSGRRC
jgi:hypothetical protein